MNTGTDLFCRAMALLHYADSDSEAGAGENAALLGRCLPLINQVYAELWYAVKPDEAFVPLTAPDQTVALPARVRETVMPYGVAMLLAQGEGDGNNQALFASLYNGRRASLCTEAERRCDVLPKGEII